MDANQLSRVQAVAGDKDTLAELRTIAQAIADAMQRIDHLNASNKALSEWIVAAADLNGVPFAPPTGG